jgi:hypothetical protein
MGSDGPVAVVSSVVTSIDGKYENVKDTEAGSKHFLHRKHNFMLSQATVTI